jgi:hypothetical protein
MLGRRLFPKLFAIADEVLPLALHARPLCTSFLIVGVELKLNASAVALRQAEIVNMVTIRRVCFQKPTCILGRIADPPLAAFIDAHFFRTSKAPLKTDWVAGHAA